MMLCDVYMTFGLGLGNIINNKKRVSSLSKNESIHGYVDGLRSNGTQINLQFFQFVITDRQKFLCLTSNHQRLYLDYDNHYWHMRYYWRTLEHSN